jgi:hypothetical protein
MRYLFVIVTLAGALLGCGDTVVSASPPDASTCFVDFAVTGACPPGCAYRADSSAKPCDCCTP